MRQSRLIDLDPAKGTGRKDLRIHRERLSDGRSKDRECNRASRIMRQSELSGKLNRQRRDRRVSPAWAQGPGHESNRLFLAVVRSYKEPFRMAASWRESGCKPGISGNLSCVRQSRGGNAVETYNRRPLWSMRKSVPWRESGSPAERTGPVSSEMCNKEMYDTDQILAAKWIGPSWSNS